MPFTVFLDTNVLLDAFVAYRAERALPSYMTDLRARRLTFEKCVFESFMAFRGLGGKKPDEGRGDWAERFLRTDDDPKTVSSLIDTMHEGSKTYAYFWANQILEARHGIEELKNLANSNVSDQARENIGEVIRSLEALSREHDRFERTCRDFTHMLSHCRVEILSYFDVFSPESPLRMYGPLDPVNLDRFVRETILPSEDFEIVFAAARAEVDVFVTKDKRLRECAASLGLNLPITKDSFCDPAEYDQRATEWDTLMTKTSTSPPYHTGS